MAGVFIKIQESNTEIIRRIRQCLIDELNSKFTHSLVNGVINLIKDDIKLILLNTPEAQSLYSGKLAGNFGIPSGLEDNFVKSIINTIADNITFTFEPIKVTSNRINGGFTFYVAQADFKDILGLPQAVITTEKGAVLPWLDWLLLKGDRLIISNFSLQFAPKSSRSHSYIMVNDKGGFWKVPSEFSGTLKNNWITRALDEKTKKISDIIANRLEKALN